MVVYGLMVFGVSCVLILCCLLLVVCFSFLVFLVVAVCCRLLFVGVYCWFARYLLFVVCFCCAYCVVWRSVFATCLVRLCWLIVDCCLLLVVCCLLRCVVCCSFVR